jgi:hypothetical protein
MASIGGLSWAEERRSRSIRVRRTAPRVLSQAENSALPRLKTTWVSQQNHMTLWLWKIRIFFLIDQSFVTQLARLNFEL